MTIKKKTYRIAYVSTSSLPSVLLYIKYKGFYKITFFTNSQGAGKSQGLLKIDREIAVTMTLIGIEIHHCTDECYNLNAVMFCEVRLQLF